MNSSFRIGPKALKKIVHIDVYVMYYIEAFLNSYVKLFFQTVSSWAPFDVFGSIKGAERESGV